MAANALPLRDPSRGDDMLGRWRGDAHRVAMIFDVLRRSPVVFGNLATCCVALAASPYSASISPCHSRRISALVANS